MHSSYAQLKTVLRLFGEVLCMYVCTYVRTYYSLTCLKFEVGESLGEIANFTKGKKYQFSMESSELAEEALFASCQIDLTTRMEEDVAGILHWYFTVILNNFK